MCGGDNGMEMGVKVSECLEAEAAGEVSIRNFEEVSMGRRRGR